MERRQPTPDEQYGLLLVERYADARQGLWEQLRQFIARLFTGMSDRQLHDAKEQAQSAAEIAAALRSAQNALAGLTKTYLDETTRLAGVQPAYRKPSPDPNPRGIPAEQEWLRPFDVYLDEIQKGRQEDYARLKALERAEVMTNDDLAIVMRDGMNDHILANGQRITGYRRVVHPEITRTGTCGLCLAASDRIYHSNRLMPLHGRCVCGVLPITEEWDVGNSLNNLTLGDLYEAAGSTAADDLYKTRYKIVEHSELGPRLQQVKGTPEELLTPYEHIDELGVEQEVA